MFQGKKGQPQKQLKKICLHKHTNTNENTTLKKITLKTYPVALRRVNASCRHLQSPTVTEFLLSLCQCCKTSNETNKESNSRSRRNYNSMRSDINVICNNDHSLPSSPVQMKASLYLSVQL